jgi:hypothetical protein
MPLTEAEREILIGTLSPGPLLVFMLAERGGRVKIIDFVRRAYGEDSIEGRQAAYQRAAYLSKLLEKDGFEVRSLERDGIFTLSPRKPGKR